MLKTKIIKTDKATLLVVELPEMVKYAVVTTFNRIGFYLPNGIISYEMLPEGNWQLLGRLPEITEEQADQVVDEYTYNTGEIDGYYDYENGTQTDCPTESLNSLMYTNEVYFENPLGEKPVESEFYWGFLHDLEKWQEAQSKVWDKERTFLFIKVD